MMKHVKRLSAVVALLLVGLIAVLAYHTGGYRPAEKVAAEPVELVADVDAAARLLSQAVRLRTVSADLSHPDFPAFLEFLTQSFPRVHATMDRVVLDPNTPLYTWPGSDPSLQPVLLAAHYDVVPVSPGSLTQWDHPPFDGVLADGFVWGRGTLDNKGALIALMATAETLISEGFTPRRTVYFSFGGDEEVGGAGARAVAQHLIETGQRPAWALDEGSFVLDDIIPGLRVPVASINLSEKGYVTVTLVARAEGGHASMPPRITAVGRIATALHRLGERPIPGGLDGISGQFFDALGRHFSIERRVLFANQWLFQPVLESVLSASPSTDAMLRTTTAPTMMSGSNAENVLATEASATVNFRLHPRDSIDSLIAHVTRTIDDPEVEIRVDRATAIEASPVASQTADGYADIAHSIRAAFGPLATVPGLTIAATDARHYALAADNAYRINPFKITGDDLTRFHGINERLSVENLERGMSFYAALLRRQ